MNRSIVDGRQYAVLVVDNRDVVQVALGDVDSCLGARRGELVGRTLESVVATTPGLAESLRHARRAGGTVYSSAEDPSLTWWLHRIDDTRAESTLLCVVTRDRHLSPSEQGQVLAFLTRLGGTTELDDARAMSASCEALSSTVADLAAVLVVSDNGMTLRCATSTGIRHQRLAAEGAELRREEVPSHPAWRAVTDGSVVRATCGSDQGLLQRLGGRMRHRGMRVAYVPVKVDGRVEVVIGVGNLGARQLGPAEMTIVRAVVNQLSLVLEHRALRRAQPDRWLESRAGAADMASLRPGSAAPAASVVVPLRRALADAEREHLRVGVLVVARSSAGEESQPNESEQGGLAAEVSRHLRPGDVIGELDDRRAVVVCPRLASEVDLARIAERVATGALSDEFGTRRHGGGVGVTISRMYGGVEPEQLIAEAAMACDRALGGNEEIEFHDGELATRMAARRALLGEFANALDAGQFRVTYQPIMDTRNQSVFAFDARVRWLHPTRGLLRPVDFEDVADGSGLEIRLAEFVLDRVSRDLRLWRQRFADRCHRAVVHLTGAAAAAVLAPGSSRAGVAVTPGVVVALPSTAIGESPDLLEHLVELRREGMEVALDSFGAAACPLTSLRHMPLDYIVLDPSLTHGIDADLHDHAIIAASAMVARSLNLDLIATDLLRPSQVERLGEIGCHLVQGSWLTAPWSPPPAPELSGGCDDA